uniref:Aromatic-L-amino-acid decarboxylase n=1 Tax=Steinernema glaseri TaxID=37863 RepID=A0A1I7YAG3_9BILA
MTRYGCDKMSVLLPPSVHVTSLSDFLRSFPQLLGLVVLIRTHSGREGELVPSYHLSLGFPALVHKSPRGSLLAKQEPVTLSGRYTSSFPSFYSGSRENLQFFSCGCSYPVLLLGMRLQVRSRVPKGPSLKSSEDDREHKLDPIHFFHRRACPPGKGLGSSERTKEPCEERRGARRSLSEGSLASSPNQSIGQRSLLRSQFLQVPTSLNDPYRPPYRVIITRRRAFLPSLLAMDSDAFRKHGKEMVDFIADYWAGMRERTPLPDVQPGYIWDLVPSSPPENPESWEAIFKDLEPVVLNANTNWHHPHFFAYYPTSLSYPSIMADMLSGAIASIGFTWKSSPSMTELEMVCTDWLVKALGLPDFFLNSHEGPGAGMIQSTASDATLVALLAARSRAVNKYKKQQESTKLGWVYSNVSRILSKVGESRKESHGDIINPENHDPAVPVKLVAYTSDQAHSSVEKDAMLAGVKLRKLRSAVDSRLGNYGVRAETLAAAIDEDRAAGLIPFIFIATIGTTSTCGVDSLVALGPVCNAEGLWLHVDAAYAGSYLICPEYRYLAEGMELVDSFNFNAHKALMVNFDCSPMWFKDATEAVSYFDVDPVYLKHEHQKKAADLRHLQIALGRRFRSLKIWFVLRALGIEHIQKHLRTMEERAKQFAELVAQDPSFELVVPQHLGLVCFRLKGANELSERLTAAGNEDRRIHLVPSQAHGVFFLRLAVCNSETTHDDIRFAFNVIREIAQKLA